MDNKALSCVMATDVAVGWDQYREKFKSALNDGRKFGMSDETIKNMSLKIADFLATKICPQTKEEELLRDMWNAANSEERKAIASVMFKIIDT